MVMLKKSDGIQRSSWRMKMRQHQERVSDTHSTKSQMRPEWNDNFISPTFQKGNGRKTLHKCFTERSDGEQTSTIVIIRRSKQMKYSLTSRATSPIKILFIVQKYYGKLSLSVLDRSVNF